MFLEQQISILNFIFLFFLKDHVTENSALPWQE